MFLLSYTTVSIFLFFFTGGPSFGMQRRVEDARYGRKNKGGSGGRIPSPAEEEARMRNSRLKEAILRSLANLVGFLHFRTNICPIFGCFTLYEIQELLIQNMCDSCIDFQTCSQLIL